MKHGYIDKYSNLESPVHRLDPRLNLIACFVAIFIIISAPRYRFIDYGFFLPAVLILIPLSKVPLAFILKKCLFILPLILAAGVLLPLSSGYVSLEELRDYNFNLPLSLIMKALSALILLVLLTTTERFDNLLHALRRLKMPAVIVQISALLYRYSFIFLDEILRTTRARISRTPGRIRGNPFRVYGNQAAIIFIRSWDRAYIIHQSMLSRGFAGDMPTLPSRRLSFKQFLLPALFLLFLLFFRIIPYIFH